MDGVCINRVRCVISSERYWATRLSGNRTFKCRRGPHGRGFCKRTSRPHGGNFVKGLQMEVILWEDSRPHGRSYVRGPQPALTFKNAGAERHPSSVIHHPSSLCSLFMFVIYPLCPCPLPPLFAYPSSPFPHLSFPHQTKSNKKKLFQTCVLIG